MKKLREANLYGAELVPVVGTLVKRYNQALAMMGFSPTALKSFRIDGMGWSPEIAEEKKDVLYLSHGDANPFAIIITPEQADRPIYFPYHSFDRLLMAEIFKVNKKQIAALTRQNAICVDIDQSIDAYYNPIDLSHYNNVHATFHVTGGMEEAKREQETLIKDFFRGDNFLDEDFQSQLLSSVRRHGDLREKDFTLKNVKFNISSFYTRAFKGVFVIRLNRKETMMIAEDKDVAKELKSFEGVRAYHIQDEGFLDILIKANHLDFNPYKLSDSRRKRLVESTFVRAVSTSEIQHDINEILESRPLYKKYMNSVGKKAIEEHVGFLQIMRDVGNKSFQPHVRKEFAHALCQPHINLKGSIKDLMWQLLGKISQWDAFNLYKYDKEEFYKAYKEWKDPQKEWAVNTILEHNK